MLSQSFAQTFQIIHAPIYAVSLREKMKDRQQQATHFQSLSPYSRFFAYLLCGRQVAVCMHASSPFSILAAAADQKSYFRMMDEIVMQIGRKRASERT